MNRDETVALFKRCEAARAEAKAKALAEGSSEEDARDIAHEAAKAVWNGWAEPLLNERMTMEADGDWAAVKDWRGKLEGRNDKTSSWLGRARVDFSECKFLVPGEDNVKVVDAGASALTSAVVESSNVNFDGCIFPYAAVFIRTAFPKASFSGAQFHEVASFRCANFSGIVQFSHAAFHGNAWFRNATFSSDCSFDTAEFSDNAWFEGARFLGTVSFDRSKFSGPASFHDACFSNATFRHASFSGLAKFRNAAFNGIASFTTAKFCNNVRFDDAKFSDTTSFTRASFNRHAYFSSTRFSGNTYFDNASFSGYAWFNRASFTDDASFTLVAFDSFAILDQSRFERDVRFNAMRAVRGFSIANARFEAVPDFIQAHFEEAPRLDDVRVVGRLIEPGPALQRPLHLDSAGIGSDYWDTARHWLQCQRTLPRRFVVGAWRRFRRGFSQADELHQIPARWRALKRLAIQAHDHDRELEFFAREIRSSRYSTDWPWPRPLWESGGWIGMFRFWFGIAYGLTSNYGRSVLLPTIWWIAGVAVAATFYLGEVDGMRDARRRAEAKGGYFSRVATARHEWFATEKGRPCYVPPVVPAAPKSTIGTGEVGVFALSEHLRRQTSASREAVQLALRDGFLILYGDADTAHRTYGCLFGLELYGGGSPIAIVPPQVGLWSAIHKLYSAVMIFLFGLALRNMLKMK